MPLFSSRRSKEEKEAAKYEKIRDKKAAKDAKIAEKQAVEIAKVAGKTAHIAAKEAKEQEAKLRNDSMKRTDSKTMNQVPNHERPYFSKIHRPLSGGVGICFGCKNELDNLFRQQRDKIALAKRPPIVFHDNFQQLHECASGCRSCRVFERALLMAQPTLTDEKQLWGNDCGTAKVTARCLQDDGKSDVIVEIRVTDSKAKIWKASVCFTRAKQFDHIKSVHPDPSDDCVYKQVHSWLDTCVSHHDQCRRLFWSPKNPSRLIKILSDTQIQLVDTSRQSRMKYIALSYCWGPSGLPNEEWALIQNGMTWSKTLARRLQPFDITELPKTLLDTVKFVRRMGIEYVWIDAVCIIQDDAPNPDKETEMRRMHEYYGNALFTLCLTSSTKSTEGFLRSRKAWRYMEGGCDLSGYELCNIDTTLDAASELSPWATRAWTLQEEHLSPRRLYWFNQSMYWSCAEAQHTEGIRNPARRAKSLATPLTLVTSLEENFLVACRNDQADVVKREWLRIVESYARRDMTKTIDRLPAISGVASRYYQAQLGRDKYIAGLWQNDFAELLGWQVIKPALKARCDEQLQIMPSWSWASLPICTAILAHPDRFSNRHEESEEDLELISTSKMTQSPAQGPHPSPEEAVVDGGEIRAVSVRGRLRPFWGDDSTRKSWRDIFTTLDSSAEVLSPEYSGADAIHSTHPSDGRIMAAGNRKAEIYGHLDYIEDIERARKGHVRIYALQLCSLSILLLEKMNHTQYRRVGVCRNFGASFLLDLKPVVISLV